MNVQSPSGLCLQAPYNGTGQPSPGEVWSAYDLSFTGANCSANLTSYGNGVGIGPLPRYTGSIATVTGISPGNAFTGVGTAG